jgi:hypothetical protein
VILRCSANSLVSLLTASHNLFIHKVFLGGTDSYITIRILEGASVLMHDMYANMSYLRACAWKSHTSQMIDFTGFEEQIAA